MPRAQDIHAITQLHIPGLPGFGANGLGHGIDGPRKGGVAFNRALADFVLFGKVFSCRRLATLA